MPTTLIAAAAIGGLAMSATGAIMGHSASKNAAAGQQEMTREQLYQEGLRKKQMTLEANRNKLETLRNAQRAKSQSIFNAVNQGAIFGSGEAGGQAQISGQANTGLLGQSQSLMIGQDMFASNSRLSDLRIKQAGYEGDMRTAQSISQFGSTLTSSAGAIGRVGGSLASGFGNIMSFGTGPGSWQSTLGR